MEENLIKCIMFDQDCFRDVRITAAECIQDEWLNPYLRKFVRIPERDFKSHEETYDSANKEVVFNISKNDRTVLNKLKVKNLVFLGSMLDGLYLEKGFPILGNGSPAVNATDLDILIEYEGLEIVDSNTVYDKMEMYLCLEETLNPCYFKLRLCHPAVIHDGKSIYVNATKLKHKLAIELEQAGFVFVGHPPFKTFAGASLSGFIEDELGVIETDLVAALTMNTWPSVADSFLTRPRRHGWPSKSLLKTITTKGCGFVAKAHHESIHTDYQWRISFASSEKMLAWSLSDHQIRAYLFFKSIFKNHLDASGDISTDMMKNILFWTIENTGRAIWSANNIYFCVEALDDTLCVSLANGKLESYFLSSLNLISHLDQRSVNSLAKKVRNIRRDLLSVILRCTESSQFKGIYEITLSRLLSYSSQETDSVLSMAYFSMFLYLRLQVKRYQIKLGLRKLTCSFKKQCKSMCNEIPPRAVWYFLEAIKLQPDSSLYDLDIEYDGSIVLDIYGMRRRVVDFWQCPLYQGIFRKVIQAQENGVDWTVTEIPEFTEFVSWVDMVCQWSGGISITHNKSSVFEYPHVDLD